MSAKTGHGLDPLKLCRNFLDIVDECSMKNLISLSISPEIKPTLYPRNVYRHEDPMKRKKINMLSWFEYNIRCNFQNWTRNWRLKLGLVSMFVFFWKKTFGSEMKHFRKHLTGILEPGMNDGAYTNTPSRRLFVCTEQNLRRQLILWIPYFLFRPYCIP